MKAVVLAAGESTRLRPLTATRPKVMLPVANRPVLEHVLLALRECGVREVVLVTGYRSGMVEGYFDSGEKLGLDLTYVRQQKLAGTADALGSAAGYVNDEYFILIYGDLYIDVSLVVSLVKKHAETGLACMSVVPVENPQQYGIVRLEDGFVRGIIEKPKAEGGLANAGIYVLPREVFGAVSETSTSPRGEFELTDSLQLLIRRGVSVVPSLVDPGCWLDLGRPWDLLEANERSLKRAEFKVEGTVERGATLLGDVGVGAGARIRSGAYVEGPAMIGEDSDIGPNCYVRPFTSIGRNVRVGNACEVKASIVFDGTQIGHLSYVGDSIVGENCNLGAGTVTANLRFDDGTVRVMVKGELMDSGRRKLGAILGDGVKTGVGVNLMPGVKVGAGAWIGPGTVVYRDVEDGTFICNRQRAGSLRVGKT